MTTDFTALPIVDLSALCAPSPSAADLTTLSDQLYAAFSTVGFAYLTHTPLSLDEAAVFDLARTFFDLSLEEKMQLAKQSFCPAHRNTYRGYFPAQPGAVDNLKEGFELGPAEAVPPEHAPNSPFQLTEPNVFPSAARFPRAAAEQLYSELQGLARTLLELLAPHLALAPGRVPALMTDSISTLRLLHYPAAPNREPGALCCTPHTDSGLLTLLHQDTTGGLEVLNAAGTWIPAPPVPGSLVVNVGDLLAQLSGGRLVATSHRVRSPADPTARRFSVPFFCEPGAAARVGVPGQEVPYGDFVRGKMGTWVEFQLPSAAEVTVPVGA